MIPKIAIEKAIEGGWVVERFEDNVHAVERVDEFNGYITLDVGVAKIEAPWQCVMVLPSFWQSLGRALGWGAMMVMIDEKGHPKEWCYYQHCSVCGVIIGDPEEGCPDGCESDDAYVESWLYHAHRFYDLILQGKDPAPFWKELLSDKDVV